MPIPTDFIPPLKLSNWRNAITTAFGAIAAIGGERHYGIDIAAPKGTPIYAPSDGKIDLEQNAGGGNMLTVWNGNVQNIFAHLSSYAVSDGESVSKGQVIGYVGDTGTHVTGAHLHWEVKINGSPINPLDLFDPTKPLDLSQYGELPSLKDKPPWEVAGDVVGGLGDFFFGGGLVRFLITLLVFAAGAALVLIGGRMVWSAA